MSHDVEGIKIQNSKFSEHGHVAYQIKGNDDCSNMKAHILFFSRAISPWGWVKGQHISESSHVAYQINGNGV